MGALGSEIQGSSKRIVLVYSVVTPPLPSISPSHSAPSSHPHAQHSNLPLPAVTFLGRCCHVKSWERVTTWSSLKASRVPCRTGLQTEERCAPPPRNPECAHGWRWGEQGSSCKLGSRLHTWQVLSAAGKRGGRWGDSEGEELGGLRAHVAHHPVSSRAQPARRAMGLAPSLTHVH